MPTQDAHLLYILTVGACVDLPIAMPLQPIYNIYPIVNRIRANSLFGLGLFSLTFVVVLIGLNITEGETTHLMIIACTSAVFNAIKALTFLPLYGAHCVGLKARLLYACTIRSLIAFAVTLAPLFYLKQFITDPSWAMLCVCGLACCVVGGAFGYLIILDGNSRKETRKIAGKLIAKITHRSSA